MTVARTEHKSNIVLGNGEIYIDVLDAEGNIQGERYFGDSVGATIAVTTERTTIQSGDGAVARDLEDIVRSVSREMGFTVHNSSLPNWALFLIGEDVDEITIAAARVAGSSAWPFKAKKGRSFQIGATDANPSGAGAVKDATAGGKTAGAHDAGANAVIVTSAAAAPSSGNTISRADNYMVDAATGRLFVLPGASGLADGTTYYVQYAPSAAKKIPRARALGSPSQITCALRYIEDDPAAGKGRHVYIRKCNLVPGGEAQLKSRDTEQQMAFTATVQLPGGGAAAMIVDGEEL